MQYVLSINILQKASGVTKTKKKKKIILTTSSDILHMQSKLIANIADVKGY